MGNTITLQSILKFLQSETGCTPEQAAEFIHALTETITESLASSGIAAIKGVGELRVIESGGGKTLEFKPEPALAREVNAPFALFEAVSLSDDISEEILQSVEHTPEEEFETHSEADETVSQASDDTIADDTIEEEMAETTNDESAIITDSEASALPLGIPPVPAIEAKTVPPPAVPQPIPSIPTANEPETESSPALAPVPNTPSNYNTENEEEEEKPRKKDGRRKEILIVVLVGVISLLTGMLAGHFGIPGLNISGVKNVKISAEEVTVLHGNEQNPELTPADTVAADTVPAQPEANDSLSDTVAEVGVASRGHVETESKQAENISTAVKPKVVTDTVQGTNYLSRIARRHYGKDIYWVYIYEENKEKIANPNNIRPGTVVVIPPAEKYGIDPKNAESVKDAERRSAEILSRSY